MLRELKLKNWIGLLILLVCLAYFWTANNSGNMNEVSGFIFALAAIAGGIIFIRGK